MSDIYSATCCSFSARTEANESRTNFLRHIKWGFDR